MFTVRHYLSEDESDPFQGWLKKLRDPIAKIEVLKRVNRIEGGNFGDHKFCRDGVWELESTKVRVTASTTRCPVRR